MLRQEKEWYHFSFSGYGKNRKNVEYQKLNNEKHR